MKDFFSAHGAKIGAAIVVVLLIVVAAVHYFENRRKVQAAYAVESGAHFVGLSPTALLPIAAIIGFKFPAVWRIWAIFRLNSRLK